MTDDISKKIEELKNIDDSVRLYSESELKDIVDEHVKANDALRETIETQRKTISDYDNNLKKATSLVDKMKEDKDAVISDVLTIQREIQREINDAPHARIDRMYKLIGIRYEDIDTQRKTISDYDNNLKKATSLVDKMKEDKDAAISNALEIQRELNDVLHEINDIPYEQIATWHEKIDILYEKIETHRKTISDYDNDLKKATSRVDKMKKDKDAVISDVLTTQRELNDVLREIIETQRKTISDCYNGLTKVTGVVDKEAGTISRNMGWTIIQYVIITAVASLAILGAIHGTQMLSNYFNEEVEESSISGVRYHRIPLQYRYDGATSQYD